MSGDIKLKVRCIGCGAKKTVGREQREMPTCDRCFMPMIVQQVTT